FLACTLLAGASGNAALQSASSLWDSRRRIAKGSPMALRVTALLVTFSTASVPFHAQTDGKAVVLRNLRVIDGTGSPPALNQTIVIEAPRLSAVGCASPVTS